MSVKTKSKFTIVIPTWNAKNLIIECIDSVVRQDFKNVNVIIRDDLSNDGTYEKILKYLDVGSGVTECYIKKHGIGFTFVRNKEKLYAPGNMYESVCDYVDDDSIVGVLDGDDALIGNTVLSEIYSIYEKTNALVVYTQYKHNTGQIGHCAQIEDTANYRNKGYWCSSHFRTAKASLIKKINKEDLMYQGDYFKVAGDLAWMYCLVEMASNEHTIFYDKVCYLYNNNTGLNDHTLHLKEQQKYAKIIQSMPPYEPLEL